MIGTDKKTIIRIVRHQASMLMILGIPLGIVIGGVLGNILFPYIARTTTINEGYYQYGIKVYAILFTVILAAASFSKLPFFTFLFFLWIVTSPSVHRNAATGEIETAVLTDFFAL